jgi:DNA-binding PadR family transcriptional regulator
MSDGRRDFFHAASLYPRSTGWKKDLIDGRWIEKGRAASPPYYRLTAAGRKALASQRNVWETFFDALNRVARIRHA